MDRKSNNDKIILDLCGGTGAWSKPYKDAGYDVRLITLLEYDVRTYEPPENVYGILAAPPCTEFSFARTNAKKLRDFREAMSMVRACLEIIWKCQYEPVSNYAKYTRLKFWALENPNRGLLKNFLGEPWYVFNPWEFGDMYKKETGLWGNFKEPKKSIEQRNGKLYSLSPSKASIEKARTNPKSMKKFDYLLMGELVELKSMTGRSKDKMKDESWKNTKTRQTLRGITPAGFAKAFFEANQ